MGSNTEFEAAKPASHIVHGAPTRPTTSQDKNPTPQKGSNSQDIMATIADDDDRLLVRIGYTPVRFLMNHTGRDAHSSLGSAETFLTMVYRFLRHLDSRSSRISASNVRRTDDLWWTCNMCLGMVHWQCDGILHSQFGYVARSRHRVVR
jgi:hypothetical protein